MSASVLVVDDDRDTCTWIENGLSRRGYQVVSALSARSALEILDSGSFDLVIADLMLGDTSGLSLCARITDTKPDIPVVVITAFGTMDTAIAAIRAGAYDFIPKPIDIHALALSVERAISHRRLREEVKRLRQAVTGVGPIADLVGASAPMKKVYEMIHQVGPGEASVLITGESGTGKELVAQALHAVGERVGGPFVALNCAAVPPTLIESELFGHTRGAFTDAKQARVGLFERAHGGTLFLDEVGEMPPDMQAKLLRVLQERKVRPIGGEREVSFDARIIAATNRDLEHEVAQGRFREDLYYRINVVTIHLPPLRARENDVLLLAQHFIDQQRRHTGKPVSGLSCEAARKLLDYHWPGNIRELANCIEHAVALTHFEEICVDDLPEKIRAYERPRRASGSDNPEAFPTLEELELSYVKQVLQATGGNKTQAARILGVGRRTLYRWLERIEGHA